MEENDGSAARLDVQNLDSILVLIVISTGHAMFVIESATHIHNYTCLKIGHVYVFLQERIVRGRQRMTPRRLGSQ